MRIAVFSTKRYAREYLGSANDGHGHQLEFHESQLNESTVRLSDGAPVVCVFVNDDVSRPVLERLAADGARMVALRSAGYNHVDVDAAGELDIRLARVPAYSPNAVAEFTVGMILALDRKYHRAHARVREGNFSLEGLMGFDLAKRTVGIVGTGQIGLTVARILSGFGCDLLGYDPYPKDEVRDLGVSYVELDELLSSSGIITLHCPLTPETHHLIDERTLALVRRGVMIINTSRGALVDTEAAIEALKDGRIGQLGLDVYEEEGDLFFEDLSDQVIQDDVFSRLLTFPNVLVTGHQAFFTGDALSQIAETTLENVTAFEAGETTGNEL
jgi:D-lactate dehydrogenase